MTQELFIGRGWPRMSLRFTAVLAMGVYLLSLASPAVKVSLASEPGRGWDAAVYAGSTCVAMLMNPSSLKGLFRGGAAAADRLWMSICASGTGANLLLVVAIVCGLRRRSAATLICASLASIGASASLIVLIHDGSYGLSIGCWLWLGSMLGLSAAAAWSLWRVEFSRAGHAPA